MTRYLALTLAATVVAMLSLTAVASSDHALVESVTPGPEASHGVGGGALRSSVTPDGTRLFFLSPYRLTPTDTDDFDDVYTRAGGTTTLVTTAPVAGAQNDVSTNYFFASEDSSRAFFPTSERLVAEDPDALLDMYEWSGGTLQLIDIGSTTPLLPNKPNWFQLSHDGSRVFFESEEQLVPGDTDSIVDIYEHTSGQPRLVTAGTATHARFPIVPSSLDDVSADGSKLLFETTSPLVPEDTDTLTDYYLWDDGAVTLVSTGPGDTGTLPTSLWAQMADDGTIAFQTAEPLLPEDTDTRIDVYTYSAGTLALRSSAAPGGAADAGTDRAYISEDGSHVFFHSGAQLSPDDSDNLTDLYENVNGTTRLVSVGTTNVCPFGPTCGVLFQTATPDGTHVVFSTRKRLSPEDANGCDNSLSAWMGR